MSIQIEHLSKSFNGNTVLKNIDLDLPESEMIGIVGPDGAGKTTLLRLIGTLLTPTKGQIFVFGKNTTQDAESIKELSGYMPQRFGLYEDLTVMQNLELYADLRGLKEEEKGPVFEKLLTFTNLGEFQTRKAGDLSGGMKQKLGLACALVKKPKILILDEPTVGVDPISRRELWKMVESLLQEKVTILWSTAYLNEAEKCQKIVVLNEGKILYFGPPKELTKRVEGRVFLIKNPEEKRKRLFELENREDIIDALIVGNDIRIVAKTGEFSEGEPTSARLEDAFIDLLGHIPKGESKLSKAATATPVTDVNEVEAIHLVKKFNSFTAVDNISFTIKKGEIFGLLGPNGAGKSTTFKMLCGLLSPTSGNAKIEGIDLQKDPSNARSKLGYMAQKFSLYGNLTVRQNINFFKGIYQSPQSTDETLEISGLQEYENTRAEILPAGIKQKLSLAVATEHLPELLFLDEPTSGMDPVSRRLFWSQMNGLARKGKTILVSTHFMDEAENCDRIALIYRGKMIQLDTPDKIKEKAKARTLEDAFIQMIEEIDAK